MSCESHVDRTLQLISRQAACIALIGLVCITIGCNSSQSGGGVAPPTSTTTTLPSLNPMAEGDVPITITGGSVDLDFNPGYYTGSGPYSGTGTLTGLWICDDTHPNASQDSTHSATCTTYDNFTFDSSGKITIKAIDKKKGAIEVVASSSKTITITIQNPDLKKRHDGLRSKKFDKDMRIDELTVSPTISNTDGACCKVPPNHKVTIVIGINK